MNIETRSHLPAPDVGPPALPEGVTSAPVEPAAIDDAAHARIAEVVEWRLGQFLSQLQEMSPAYAACMADIAVARLAEYMSGSAAEELLTALARRVVSDRRNRKDSVTE